MKKNIINIICAAVAMIVFASCNSLLEPKSPSTFDDATVYASYDLAQGTIYSIEESFCETNSYRGRFLPWYGFNTDIEWYNGFGKDSKPVDNKNEIASYGITTNNTQMNLSNGPYNLMYTGIERANLAIEGLRQYGDVANKKDMASLLGEALTLRAMIYYDLIKAWGDVPARFTSVNADNLYVAKSNRDVIYKQILADLEEAIPYLYLPGENTATLTTTRINKLFAEGLYARIVLAASGMALRPVDDKVGTGADGEVRLSSDPVFKDKTYYSKALEYLKDVINSGKASLESDYETLWRNFNNLDVSAGKEILYSIPFSNGRGRWNYTFAIKNEGAIINGYNFEKGGTAGPTPNMWFRYDSKDVRRDITCVNYSWQKESNSPEPAGISKWYFGKYRFEWMDNNPYKNTDDDGAKPVVMRYSDILLMAAEIDNEINQAPSADAKGWLLQVRKRAFKGNESLAEDYVNGISGHDDFLEAIQDERALEFCGEFLRKGDLIRWGKLKENIDGTKQELYSLREKTGDYSYLSGNIYWKLGSDNESVVIWGLGKDEQTKPEGSDWELIENYVKFDDSKKSDLFAGKIENIYLNDPEQWMYWPIFDISVGNSQGAIVNDYAAYRK